MTAGAKTLHNILLRAQRLDGVDHLFSNTVGFAPKRCRAEQSRSGHYIGKNEALFPQRRHSALLIGVPQKFMSSKNTRSSIYHPKTFVSATRPTIIVRARYGSPTTIMPENYRITNR